MTPTDQYIQKLQDRIDALEGERDRLRKEVELLRAQPKEARATDGCLKGAHVMTDIDFLIIRRDGDLGCTVIEADSSKLFRDGYRAGQNPSAHEADCPHISTRFITAWREGFRSARNEQTADQPR
jgi:hypothetical protein